MQLRSYAPITKEETMIPTRTLWLSPLERLYAVQREFDRTFSGETNGSTGWVPAMDVVETADEVRCLLEVPGLAPQDIDIRVEDNVLIISGEKKFSAEHENQENGFRSIERRYGQFERHVTLPRTIDLNHVKAQHENGMLLVTLPKAETAKPRRIEIEGAGSARELNK
jgi:HSP20 family protein